jgi:hypothetical protein
MLYRSAEFLQREKSIATFGLFQLPGNFGRVRDYISKVNAGQPLPLLEDETGRFNAHDVALLLKQFLKQLHQPLVPFSLYRCFMAARMGTVSLDEARLFHFCSLCLRSRLLLLLQVC